jgi:hypothetical protein
MTYNDLINIALLTLPWIFVILYIERSEKRYRETRIYINQIETLQLELIIWKAYIQNYTVDTEEAKESYKDKKEFIDFYKKTIESIYN